MLRPVRLLIALALACSGVVLAQMPAHACRCVQQNVPDHTKQADAVFSGVVMDSSKTTTGKKDHPATTYDIEADTIYKGDVTSRVEVVSRNNSCGLGDLRADRRYIFFADARGSELTSNTCSGTAKASAKLTRRVVEILGEGTTLAPPSAPGEAVFTRLDGAAPAPLTRLAAPGAALILVGVLGLVLVRRLGSTG